MKLQLGTLNVCCCEPVTMIKVFPELLFLSLLKSGKTLQSPTHIFRTIDQHIQH
ncbi:hypothetical protein ACFL27_17590 [candidate division CSSED10-310 bacterium]|uniref:Uncharacterized protein n=1 Tax=candidate division CSSED10-310 bacterium TaxID=2855610 RepID=A0ABV6Z0N3_UNCC1